MANIAVDARPLTIPTTGIGRYTEALLTRIVKSNHQWFLYAHRPLLVDFSAHKNVTVHHGSIQKHSLSSFYAQIKFPHWARTDKIDLFWSPRHHLPLALPKKVKKIVTIHDMVWKKYPDTMSYSGKLLESILMEPSVRQADAIIAVSENTAKEVRNEYVNARNKVSTILEAPFLTSQSNSDSTGDYFLFVGTIEPRKNITTLLSAYSQYIQMVDKPLQLKICGGKGWRMPALEVMLDHYNLIDHIDILGYVEDEQLECLYRDSRALVMPSLYEGFGLPLVESFSKGRPAITSNRGAMREIGEGAAIFIDPEDAHSIATALEQLTIDMGLVEQLNAQAIDRAKLFCWDKAAIETLTQLEKQIP